MIQRKREKYTEMREWQKKHSGYGESGGPPDLRLSHSPPSAWLWSSKDLARGDAADRGELAATGNKYGVDERERRVANNGKRTAVGNAIYGAGK